LKTVGAGSTSGVGRTSPVGETVRLTQGFGGAPLRSGHSGPPRVHELRFLVRIHRFRVRGSTQRSPVYLEAGDRRVICTRAPAQPCCD